MTLLDGFLLNIELFAVTLVLSLPLGLVVSFGTMSRFKPLSLLVRLYVYIMRSTPLMLQLAVVFYLPGIVFGPGHSLGRMGAAVLAFVLNYAAYFSEIFRGGIQGVPAGQREAGQVLGMTRSQIFFQVTLLQVVKRIVPPMGNEIITLVKDTSLSNFIMVGEIIKLAKDFGNKGMIWPLFYAGAFFPEFKEAAAWRKSGIDIMNREINVQVYNDGGQFELDPHYHLAAINIFCKALNIADLNGFRNEFPQEYLDTIEKMIVFYANVSFPDYTNPCFSDAKLTNKKEMLKNYRSWSKMFPKNQFIKYLATDGKEGALPEYLSKGFLKSGFFVFRNSWGTDATQMVVKAGPKAFWHCQPDNGTFELWFNGKNLFPDSGSYVYAGEGEVMEQRNWHRQTCVHNTVTLNNKNLDQTESVTKLWQPEGNVQILVTENPSYKNLKHRRSVFFVDNSYFVIVDEMVGSQKGSINLHYQMPKGEIANSREDMTFVTQFEEGSNMKLQCFGPEGMTMKKEPGWCSTAYRKRYKRMNVSFNVKKDSEDAVRYITVICPIKNSADAPKLSAKFKNKTFNENGLEVEVKVNGKKQSLNYKL